MFDNRKIKHLRKLPDGNNIVLIWIMLLTMAGRCNSGGLIFLTENIPYTTKMLADELDFEENTVKLALSALEQFGMIVYNEEMFAITGWSEHQNIDGLDKIREQTKKRVAAYREKQKALMSSNVCQYCGETATGYDHIVPISRGGEDIDANKVPCCIDCNRIKNNKPLADFLNANRSRIRDDLIAQNEKLSKFVTLCNVTGRYNVTQCNATDKDKEKEKDKKKNNINSASNAQVNEFFDSIWKLYPNKKGKGQVSDTKRKELYKVGFDKLKTAIDRYLVELSKDDWRKPQYGSTFFNSGYVDYLDENYSPTSEIPKVGNLAEINGEMYEVRNGKYYIPNGNGIEVNPYVEDDLPF
jgi:predicted phage replisome organizer